ncbi:MAG: hypothetical protein AAF438_02110 [Pseudomonadota bacterium]
MHINLFFCDEAETTDDGKLNATGIFDELYAPGFPAQQERVVLAGVATWNRDDDGDKSIRIDIVGPEQKCIFSIEAVTTIDERPEDRAPAKSHFIFPLEKLTFDSAGDYQVQVTVGDEKHCVAPLHIVLAQE